MPRVKPQQAEAYLCTTMMMDPEVTHYIVGFKPNATKMTAHHMLVEIYPGSYWSSSYITVLSLVESFIVMLGHVIKNQLKTPY